MRDFSPESERSSHCLYRISSNRVFENLESVDINMINFDGHTPTHGKLNIYEHTASWSRCHQNKSYFVNSLRKRCSDLLCSIAL